MFDPATVLGSLQWIAGFLVVTIIIIVAFMANERHAPVFSIAIGVILGFFMGAGWIPENYYLVGTVLFVGFLGLLVGRRG